MKPECIILMPEPPIDPPPDDNPECPACDAIIVSIRGERATCEACGWVNDPNWPRTQL